MDKRFKFLWRLINFKIGIEPIIKLVIFLALIGLLFIIYFIIKNI